VAAVADAVGAQRTGVRLSPNEERQGVNDSNPQPLFVAASEALSRLEIAYIEVREPGFAGTNGKAERPPVAPLMRRAFTGRFVLNSDYDGASGQAALDAGEADAISFGRPFISNPDLPGRLARGLPLAPNEMETWYLGGENGYTDYPAAAA
jgi:2,4-dienoyl-CoA reductase-like NADH-dependent reductase (Old Yellow Enzyme family)